MTARELYDVDFFEWTQRNAELLYRGCIDQADIPHIAEELADMGSRDQREVESHLKRLVMHLLKWQIQTARRSRSWLGSINSSRDELDSIFTQSPSLRRHAAESLDRVYAKARRAASIETGLSLTAFPAKCPYAFEQLIDFEFIPS
jgi:hypothetical protein